MRIKLLAFPALLALSIVIAIAYIKPEVGALKDAKKDLAEQQKILQEVIDKKSNISKLKEDLNKNQDKENFVLAYLPAEKSEERIIDGLNYLAANSGVSLTNLSVEKVQEKAEEAPAATMAGSSKDIIFNQSKTGDTGAPVQPAVKLRSLKIKASAMGNYENIKTFLEQVYKMEMFNSLNSFLIAKPEKQNQAAGAPPVDPSILSATLDIDFGYLSKTQIDKDYDSPVFSLESFDLSPYKKLTDLVVKKIPVLDTGERGRANPFLP